MQDGASVGLGRFLNMETGEVLITGFGGEAGVDPEDLVDEKYLSVQAIEHYEAYPHMENFTLTLPSGPARTELEQALIRSHPFGHFADVLGSFPRRTQGLARVQGRSHGPGRGAGKRVRETAACAPMASRRHLAAGESRGLSRIVAC